MKIQKLINLIEEKRPEIIKIIDQVLKNQNALMEKEFYIGVQGEENMMLIKTPASEENSDILVNDALYKFYEVKK